MARGSIDISGGIDATASALGSIASAVGSGLSQVVSSSGSYSGLLSKTGGGEILSSLTSIFKGTASGAGNILSSLINKYGSSGTSGANNTFDMISSTGSSILTSLVSVFKPSSTSKLNISNAINTLKNNIFSRTGGSSFFSNLFGNSASAANAIVSGATKISPLNVFGGLKNLISNVKSGIGAGGDTVSRLSTTGLLDLSTTLGSVSQRIVESFGNWKNLLQGIVGTGAMIGESLAYELAENQDSIEVLFDEFAYYSTDMVYTLQDMVQGTEYVDEYGYYDDGSYYAEPSQGYSYYTSGEGPIYINDGNVAAYADGDYVEAAIDSYPGTKSVQVAASSYDYSDGSYDEQYY